MANNVWYYLNRLKHGDTCVSQTMSSLSHVLACHIDVRPLTEAMLTYCEPKNKIPWNYPHSRKMHAFLSSNLAAILTSLCQCPFFLSFGGSQSSPVQESTYNLMQRRPFVTYEISKIWNMTENLTTTWMFPIWITCIMYIPTYIYTRYTLVML